MNHLDYALGATVMVTPLPNGHTKLTIRNQEFTMPALLKLAEDLRAIAAREFQFKETANG